MRRLYKLIRVIDVIRNRRGAIEKKIDISGNPHIKNRIGELALMNADATENFLIETICDSSGEEHRKVYTYPPTVEVLKEEGFVKVVFCDQEFYYLDLLGSTVKTDCAFCDGTECSALSEMVCGSGNCRFYKKKSEFDKKECEREIKAYAGFLKDEIEDEE